MSAAILYKSFHGNTVFLSRVMAAVLERNGPVQLAHISHAPRALLTVPDLLVLGAPATDIDGAWRFLQVVESLPSIVVERSSVVVFNTCLRHPRAWAESTASALARAVHRRGAILILPPESFFLLMREGPLDEGELVRAERWAQDSWERADRRATLAMLVHSEVV